METRKISKSININASTSKVWDVLLQDKYIPSWYKEFSAGSYAVTEDNWKEGSKVTYRDESGFGMISKVLVNQPGKELSVEFTGVYTDGKEDFDSAKAKEVQGGKETYVLSENNGGTTLAISSDMDAEYYDMMSDAWDKALAVIKDLAEKN